MRFIYHHIGCFIVVAFLCMQYNCEAQVGIGTTTPNTHTALDIESTKGILLPRLNIAQQTTLAALLSSTNKGLLISDSLSNALLYWNGTKFTDFDAAVPKVKAPITISTVNTISLNAGTAVGDLLTWDGGANWVNMQPAPPHFTLIVDNRQPYLAVNYCMALQGIFPSRNDAFLGEVSIFSFSYAPKGWAQCNGQIMSINQNQALFSLLGTMYGGNGVTTFVLPNLEGRVPMHIGNNHTQGEIGGIETNTVIQ